MYFFVLFILHVYVLSFFAALHVSAPLNTSLWANSPFKKGEVWNIRLMTTGESRFISLFCRGRFSPIVRDISRLFRKISGNVSWEVKLGNFDLSFFFFLQKHLAGNLNAAENKTMQAERSRTLEAHIVCQKRKHEILTLFFFNVFVII